MIEGRIYPSDETGDLWTMPLSNNKEQQDIQKESYDKNIFDVYEFKSEPKASLPYAMVLKRKRDTFAQIYTENQELSKIVARTTTQIEQLQHKIESLRDLVNHKNDEVARLNKIIDKLTA